MLTTAAFSMYGQSGLDLYVSLYILEYFVLTLLHSPFNPRAQKIIDITGYILFVVFMIIVALKVLEILVGAKLS
jgi:membrane-associated protease RseP (regulator of RpoE activity)